MSNKKLQGIIPINESKIENAKLDVVFIHGLNGDAADTWINERDEFWLSWLDDDLDDVCVWSVGYDATPSKWIDTSMPMEDTSLAILDQLHLKLKNVPSRPIIFITHSMGGLIAKYLLNYANTTPKYQSILENTHGVVFLAVPHDGAGGADLLLNLNLLFRVNKNVKQLSKDDPALRKLNNDFMQLVPDNDLRCLSFFEQKPISLPNELSLIGLKILSFCPIKVFNLTLPFNLCVRSPKLITIVSESSASGNFTREPAIGILEDHMSICKLDSRDSQIYANTIDMICSINTDSNPSLTQPKTQTSKLPTTTNELFGREDELKLLDEAWVDEKKYMLNLVAMGGMGKSALMNKWIAHMAEDTYRGATRVYSWSFYSQGSAEDTQVSADTFFDDALVWFGYEGEKLSSGNQKVDALVALIKAEKTLLILDGLEPLQYPVAGAMGGSMRDKYFLRLLKELSMGLNGLVLLSSRQKVVELEGKSETNITQQPLQGLNTDAGVALFRHYGIVGSDKELEETVSTYQGHALSLNLLACYLCDYEDKDIKKKDQLAKLTAFPEETLETRHAFRVMQGYEKKLARSTDLKILYMLGLFDRPTSKEAVDVLRDAKIAHLFGVTINSGMWKATLNRLREQGLLNQPNPEYPHTLDTHPLIRQYFATRFETCYPKVWQEAHLALYHYYKELPQKHQPDTLEEMEPLFAAVVHGCAAGLHQEALVEVYYKRIKRDAATSYLSKQLGATSTELSILSHFFYVTSGEHWQKPVEGLDDVWKGGLLNWVGLRLRALGRLHEASVPMHAALQLIVEKEGWESASSNASNISELQLLRGRITQAPDGEYSALEIAKKCVEWIDKTDKTLLQVARRTTLADVYHQVAENVEVQSYFEEAECIQKESQPDYPKLYSLWGFRYCDFLLSQGEYEDVLKRTKETLEWLQNAQGSLVTVALDKLSLGRAKMQRGLSFVVDAIDPTVGVEYQVFYVPNNDDGVVDGIDPTEWQESKKWLDEAVEELRESEDDSFLPRALLARATYGRFVGCVAEASKDLQEVYELSMRAGMQLFLCDCHLEAARLACSIEENILGLSAKEHYVKAKEIVEATGYKRRLPELTYLGKMV